MSLWDYMINKNAFASACGWYFCNVLHAAGAVVVALEVAVKVVVVVTVFL